MILLLNGAFGVGKTTVAKRLVRELPNMRILDPEAIGFVLRRIPGLVRGDDYQHLPLWRTLTVNSAWAMRRLLRCDLIVPMTLAYPDYFDEIRTRLAHFDADVRQVCLTATENTLHARLRARGDPDDAWSHAQVERCVRELGQPRYSPSVETDSLDPAAVAAAVLRNLGADD